MIKMGAITRRSSRSLNVLTATCGISLVVGGIALVDQRVRETLAQILTGHGATTEVGGALINIQEAAGSYVKIVHEQAINYQALTIFGIAAAVFVYLMTRIKF